MKTNGILDRLFREGVSHDDTLFHGYVVGMRDSIVDAAKIMLESDGESRQKCGSIMDTLTATLFMLEEIEKEFSIPQKENF